MFFMEQKKWSLQIGGRILEVETGLLAGQANGAVTVRYGDTIVLATAVMSKNASRISGYFPLMVDFEERYYAAGKIKGSRFIKREGRPSEDAILTGRVVDRTIRPLFDGRMRNEVQVVVTVLFIAGANEVPEMKIIKPFAFGQEAIRKICLFLKDIQTEAGQPKAEAVYVKGTSK